jgi:hypothetical protein
MKAVTVARVPGRLQIVEQLLIELSEVPPFHRDC